MDLNALRQAMDFYQSVMPQLPNYGPSMFGGAEGAMNLANNQGRALNFALRMASNQDLPRMQQSPDYFTNLGGRPSPVSIGDNPVTPRVNALARLPMQAPNAPQMGNNFLARFLK